MKINAINSRLFASLLSMAGLWVSGAVRADDSDLKRTNEAVEKAGQMILSLQQGQQPQLQQNSPFGGYSWGGSGSSVFAGGHPGTNVTSAIRKAAEAVRDAKGDEAKSDAQKKLAELLSKCYDDDMVQREHELKQIEERLTRLRELLDRRRTKKQEIIDLQTKVALNEAEGLGFYDSERPAKAAAKGFFVAPRVEAAVPAPAAPPAIQSPSAPPAPAAPKTSSR